MVAILGNRPLLLQCLALVEGVTPGGANANLPLLGHLLDQLDQFDAPFLGKLGKRQADDLAVHRGIDAELAFPDALGDVLGGGGVEGGDLQQAGLRRADDGEFLELHPGPVGGHVDVDILRDGRRRLAGAHASEFLHGVGDGFFHGLLGLQLGGVCVHDACLSGFLVFFDGETAR